jgi:hypothetical protein
VARIRTIKPEFWQDEKLTPLSDVDRLLFLFLVSSADDCGRVLDKPVKIEADMFDGETDRRQDVCTGLANLSRIGRIRRGKTSSGQRIIEIVNWGKHQKVDHPNTKSAFPEIVETYEDTDIREAFANDSRGIREAFAHHTNDLRPVPTTSTNDQQVHHAKRRRGAPRSLDVEAKYPHFSPTDRTACLDAWRGKIGDVNVGQLISVLGPSFRTIDDPYYVTHPALVMAVRDYCGIVTKGRSAPWASPADLGKRLAALAKNATDHRDDPLARLDGALMIVHGSTKVAA